MLQNPRKTLGFKKSMVYKIPPGGMGGENRHYSMHTSLFLYVGNFILFCKLCHANCHLIVVSLLIRFRSCHFSVLKRQN